MHGDAGGTAATVGVCVGETDCAGVRAGDTVGVGVTEIDRVGERDGVAVGETVGVGVKPAGGGSSEDQVRANAPAELLYPCTMIKYSVEGAGVNVTVLCKPPVVHDASSSLAVMHCHCAGVGHEPVADVPMKIIVSKEDPPHVEKVVVPTTTGDCHANTSCPSVPAASPLHELV